jgi:hypothetical protein
MKFYVSYVFMQGYRFELEQIKKMEVIDWVDDSFYKFFKNSSYMVNELVLSADDDYLDHLFAMRVRDMIIVHSCQRLEKPNYLLMLGVDQCHDGDEWFGIYDDIFELRYGVVYMIKFIKCYNIQIKNNRILYNMGKVFYKEV